MSATLDAALAADATWEAIVARDPRHDDRFVYGVSTTRIFCRPSCPSRRPRRENVSIFTDAAGARAAGYRPCKRCRPEEPARESLAERARNHLDDAGPTRTSLAELARAVGASPSHLQRIFTAAYGVSPREYQAARRDAALRDALRAGRSVSRATWDAGFTSTGRLYESANGALGMRPSEFRRGGIDVHITFAVAPCSLGLALVALTERGVCAVALGDDEETLIAELRRDFPAAILEPADPAADARIRAALDHIEGRSLADVPLDLAGTIFQRRVWDALRSIPQGATLSYQALARQLGRPTAARAVARACASNRVAILVPCHRVRREDGGVGGYRWGVERKTELLDREARDVEQRMNRR